jgi:CDP-diacylglycerol--glycerol-3-phosphate 3-phosphatidyltransferase
MPSVYQLKPAFQNLLRPVVQELAQRRITANQVTIAALSLSVIYGLYLSRGSYLAFLGLGPFLLLRMAMNAIDGMLAREHNMKSRLGAILNETSDILSDAALYLPLAYAINPTLLIPASAFLALLAASEITGVLGGTLGAGRRYEGPFGKSDRALFFGALSFMNAFSWIAMGWWVVLWWLTLPLMALTCWNRTQAILRSPVPPSNNEAETSKRIKEWGI